MEISSNKTVFRVHAIRRMFERRISKDEVFVVIRDGKTIIRYSDDRPYPSRLLLGWAGDRALHVLVADNSAGNEQIVITVYEPDLSVWQEGFERRKE